MTHTEMMEEVQGCAPYVNRIDAEVASECGCESCKSKNVSYRGFKGYGQYFAFIECHNCGNCEAF